MPTTTTNYALNLPTVGSDDDQWGSYLNTNFTTIDTQLKTLSDAIADQDLEELGNVVNTTPAEDQVLQFNGQNWSASTLVIADISGLQTALDNKADDSDLTGITTNPADGSVSYAKLNTALQVQVDRILLTDDDATPTDNQILKYSATDEEWKYADLPGSTVQTLSDVNTASLADDALMVYNSTAGEFQFESGSTLRTTLGVDVSGTDNSTPVTLSGSLDYLTLSGQEITLQQINLTTDVTDTLPVASGGTGSATASDARTALQVQPGVHTQAYDAGLQSISGLTTAADKMIYTTSSDTYAVTDLTAAGRAILDDADASAQRTTLGLGTAATTASTDYATAVQGSTADSALQDVVDDSTPQLGGNLDVNGNSIVSASNGNIAITPNGTGDVVIGNFTFDADQSVGAGEDNYVLTYDNSSGLISLEASAGGGGGGGLSNIVSDTSPQLGGDLDVNGQSIVSVSAGNIAITPDTTGKIILDGLSWPTADGNADQVLKTDGSGNLSFVNQSGGGGSASYIEHSSTVSDSLAITSGTNRMYIGNTSFSSAGTMAGYLLIIHGFANFLSASALNVTGTLNVVS